jgi:tRNA threonylcarbamoyladenosine biosynthesis protein TsaB
MSLILNIETATKNCSVAVAKNGQVLASREIAEAGYSHAEKLHVFIGEALKELSLKFSDLQAIAVSKGPGSYTGLRIGVSATKGFCYALDIPLISINTLQVLASQVQIENGIIIPMLDARRMEVYSAQFNPKHDMTGPIQAEIISSNSYTDNPSEIIIVGDCQEKLRDILTASNIKFLPDIVFPSAKDMTKLSFKKFNDKDFEDVAYFEPLYLKEFMTAKPK